MQTDAKALPNPGAAHAVVVGGGTMGADVAVVLTRASCRTTVIESNAERAAGVPARVAANLEAIGRQQNAALVATAPDLDAVDWSGVDLVIECIPERLDIKQALFAELERRARPDAILASNSSSFPISAIGQGLASQGRMLGLHFFMPAHLVPLVEVVLGAGSDGACADALIAFMRRCGSVPVKVAQDLPGFLANRLQHALSREAFDLNDRGIASPEDVDAAVRFGFGFRFGIGHDRFQQCRDWRWGRRRLGAAALAATAATATHRRQRAMFRSTGWYRPPGCCSMCSYSTSLPAIPIWAAPYCT